MTKCILIMTWSEKIEFSIEKFSNFYIYIYIPKISYQKKSQYINNI